MMALVVPRWLPISALGVFVWSAWLIRQLLGAGYRPAVNRHSDTASVIVPVYREDPEVLERCLRSWQSNGPDEIFLVIDKSEHALIQLATRWSAEGYRI